MKASSFVKAAALFESRVYESGIVYGACDAIGHVLGHNLTNEIDAFNHIFSPREHMSDQTYWGNEWSHEELYGERLFYDDIDKTRMECRILALLFAAQMVETGDLA